MLSSDVIRAIEPQDVRDEVKRALATLALSHVILYQIEAEKEQILSGNSEQDARQLAKDIKRYRRRTQELQALHELGQFYIREMQHGTQNDSQ